MEQLLIEQKAEIEAFKKLYSAFKGELNNKLSIDVIKSKLRDVNHKFEIITERNGFINEYLTDENKKQPYFVKGSFAEVRALNIQFVGELNEAIKKQTIRPKSMSFGMPNNDSGSDATANATAMDGLSVIEMQKFELDGLFDLAAAIDENSQTGYVKSILNMMTIVWTELRKSIYQERADGTALPFDYICLQQRYLQLSGNLNENLSKNSNHASSKSDNQVSLPKLQLQKFDGKVSEWKSFIALFDRMVHQNQKLDKGLKIEYLKTCIEGDARRLINHVDPTPENYEICYAILRKRFDNKREIMGQLLDNILNLPKMKSEDGILLKNIHDTVYECMMAIKNIGISNDQLSGALLTHILTHKMDSNTVMHYECQLKDVREPQTLDDFLTYIEKRFMALQSAQAKNDNFNQSKKIEKKTNEKNSKCSCCNETHALYKCSSFGKKSVQERIEFARSKKLCLNCFSDFHKTNECKSTFTCKTCKKKHNSLLHLETKNYIANQTKSNVAQVSANELVFSEKNSNIDLETTANVAINAGSTMLATAIIGVEAKNGSKIALRALIDPGSQSSFITANALQTLKLRGDPITVNISGIAALSKTATSALVELTIFPRFASSFVMRVPVIVLNKLTNYDNEFQSLDSYEHLKNLNLADPSLTQSSPIDIVLGADQYGKFIKSGVIKSLDCEPFAQNTEFGWIVLGPSKETKAATVYSNIVSLISNVDLNKQIDKFFGSDDFTDQKTMTEDEEKCEQHFQVNYSRNEAGRYVVKHSFIGGIEVPSLGNSRKYAIATQLQLEKRFEKNPKLKAGYHAFIQEFIDLRQMEVAKTNPNRDAYYLPHHCVFKDSTTTKLRVVFNASQITDNGKSLNEQLAIGSIDQPEMIALLIKFRFYKYAFTADLEKMYRQILLDESQLDTQRILWRWSPDEPLRDYILKTIVYGTADAPYLATRTLKQLAIDTENIYPIAAKIIRACMYMDDVCSGGFSKAEVINAYHELKAAFQSAGFNLRKWCSNAKELLNEIPECERELQACNGNVKALGICWSAIKDEFTFEHKIPVDTIPKTKRALYSEISSLFDPLGWISPITIKGKNLMQILWKQKVDWEHAVPSEILETWLKIKSELHFINEIKMPRWVQYMPDEINELHGFCDASEVGYAAVVYVRNVNSNSVSLLLAKAKVAPIKDEKIGKTGKQKSEYDNCFATIPRLELSGAELLANLINKVLKQTQFSFSKIRLYTDSKIVLGWINGNPKRFKTFVANKICKINDVTNKADWMHVSSENNPADCASRGILPSQLSNHPLWWTGPGFLRTGSGDQIQCSGDYQSDIEVNALAAGVQISRDTFLPDVSSLYRMKRIIVYCQRFINNCKTTMNHKCGVITATEMNIAERLIVRIIQNETFELEIKLLKEGKPIANSSSLRKLTPELDENDIIRVGGRLKNAEIPTDAKNPIVLPKCNAVSKLIIREAHFKCMHGGPRLTEATLRQKYWALNSQHEIKNVINSCITCFKQKNRTMNQIMAHLPKNRVNMLEKPFTNAAVDYTGAYDVKLGKGRGFKTSKAYICIFACMATKAIHAELVSDLSAEAYIAAFRRLVAIRGMVMNLYSDNGTCFVRADKDLQQLSELQEEEYNTIIGNELTKCGTNWHFSPPGAPHFNGLAEAAVKSVKLHLKKAIGQLKLTYEEFSTVLRQVEACVNSRPLCAMSSDPNDLESITPGHFLVGAPLLAPPDESFLETNANWLSRWQLVQKVSQVLWKRFQSEYLTQLQERSKWFEEKSQPKINQLVLIKEENTPSCQWPMARILEVHRGDDNRTRVVTVKMKDKIFKRPITKLAPLPIENDMQTQQDINVHLAKINKTKPKYKFNVLPVIIAMLTVFATSLHAAPVQSAVTPFTITRFDTPPGLYFEQQSSAFMVGASWNVIAFINIRGLHDEYVSIRSHVSRLRDHCFEIFYSGRERCNNVVSHLEDSVTRLSDANDMIFDESKHRITKRAVLDPVGNFFGDVFGILDSRFRLEYQQDMRRISGNQNHLTLLMQNHTTILESTLNVLKNEQTTLIAQNKHIVTMSQQIKNLKNSTEAELIFNNAVTYIEHLLADFKTQQDAVIEILWRAEKNHLNHNLFTPKQVKLQGEIIIKQVGAQFLVPEGADMYRVSTVKPYRTANQIIFKISIPLLNPQKFKIFKIIQVPRLFKNEMWWIYKGQMERFLITAANREKYQIVEDLSDCQPMNDDVSICERPRRWIGASSQFCIWDLFNQKSESNCQAIKEPARTIFIDLAEDNKFIFVCNFKQQVTFICDDLVLHPELDGEGIININEKCKLKTLNSEQEILPRLNIDDESREIIVPRFPHFVIPDNKFNIFPKDEEDKSIEISTTPYNFTELFAMLNETKKNTVLQNELNIHDVHHYSLLYFILIVIILIVIWYHLRTKNIIKNHEKTIVIEHPVPAPRRMISMPDIRGMNMVETNT